MAFCLECLSLLLQLHNFLTFVYQLSPAFGPFCQLLCVCFFNASSLMNTVHQVVTQTIPIIHPLYRPFVIANLVHEEREEKNGHVCWLSNCKQENVQLYQHECVLPPKSCHWRHQLKSPCSQTWLPSLIIWKRVNKITLCLYTTAFWHHVSGLSDKHEHYGLKKGFLCHDSAAEILDPYCALS